MYKLRIGSLDIPTVYVCDGRKEAMQCRARGVPYLIKPADMSEQELVRLALLRTLKSKFPDIDWRRVLNITGTRKEIVVKVPGSKPDGTPIDEVGISKGFSTGSDGDEKDGDLVVGQAADSRWFIGGFEEGAVDYCDRKLGSFIGDFAAEVKIEELQALSLLPTFLDDITEAIKRNLYGLNWTEGYNKRLGVPLGNFNAASEKTNLMILDVSGSIPRGVSSTMLTLIDTLRIQANADLIVTGSTSMLWKAGEKLPSPEWIRCHIGYGNEASQFYKLLEDNYVGKKIGNLVCFGDDDSPYYFGHPSKDKRSAKDFEGTEIDMMWSFHTYSKRTPGYAKWAKDFCGCQNEVVNTEWCEYMTN